MTRKVGIIIQARMGSTRLPGKVLMPLPKEQIEQKAAPYAVTVALDWTIRACLETGFQVVVATSINPEDDAIADRVHSRMWDGKGALVFRGSAEDVLDRMYQAALLFDFTEIVRITGDCPFIDPDVIRQVVALRQHACTPYASNVDPPSWPDGLDVQVATIDALHHAWTHAKTPTERDTVMQYIATRRTDFSVVNLLCPFQGAQQYRWVLDYERDYKDLSAMAELMLKRNITVPRFSDCRDIADEIGTTRNGARNERYLAHRTQELGAEKKFIRNLRQLEEFALRYQPYGASTYSKSHVAWGADGPLFTSHAQGSRVWDVDGNEFIDFTGGLGTTILGHADSDVNDAVLHQLSKGIASPLAHAHEAQVSRRLISKVWPAQMLDRFKVVWGKNGSDVTSAAVRVARVATGRSSILIETGGYHGWHDWALAWTERGNSVLFQDVLRQRNIESLESSLEEYGACFAAVIVEPDHFAPEALAKLIERAHTGGALVIFDEMVTFGRYPNLTYAATHGLEPDLICVGKCLGNGMPITALVGRAEIMDHFVQGQPGEPYAFYSGTHFGEGLSLAAAHTVLNRLDTGVLAQMKTTAAHVNIIVGQNSGLPIKVGPAPLSRLTFPTEQMARQFRYEMMHRGILVYSAFFAMMAHSDADLEHLDRSIHGALEAISNGTARSPVMKADTQIMRS